MLLKSSFVLRTAPGRSSGPPNEIKKAVMQIDRKGGKVDLGEILFRKLYNKVAKIAGIMVESITITRGIGSDVIGDSVIGIKYCSPSNLVNSKKRMFARTDKTEINIPA
jgi:hypothetical protein